MPDDIDSFIRPAGANDGATRHVVTAESMSDHLCKDLLNDLDLGDWELTDWEADFVESCLGRDRWTLKQRAVILKMANKYKLL